MKKFVRSKDVKIPSLLHLLGCHITWDEVYYNDWEASSLVSYSYEGTIVGINDFDLTIQDMDGDALQVPLERLYAGSIYQDDIARSISSFCSAIRRRDQLAARENDRTEYDIYRLVDPRDRTIRYVGMSMDAQFRFEQHLSCNGNNIAKITWIQELFSLGLLPLLEIIEKVKGKLNTLEREQYWIQFYEAQGAPLTNIREGVAA